MGRRGREKGSGGRGGGNITREEEWGRGGEGRGGSMQSESLTRLPNNLTLENNRQISHTVHLK